jgi:hypothetical protein
MGTAANATHREQWNKGKIVDAVQMWNKTAGLKAEDFLFPSRSHDSPHLGTRQYGRTLERWESRSMMP